MSDSERKPSPVQKGKGNNKWEAKHTSIIVAGIVSLVMQHRAELYALDGIVGEVDGHGNDRTLKCIERVMKAFAVANNVDARVLTSSKKRKTAPAGGDTKKHAEAVKRAEKRVKTE